jgi:hypothetical protein
LTDPALRSIVERDIAELAQALSAGLAKSSFLLAGSVLEGALLDVLIQKPAVAGSYFPKRTFPKDFSLKDLIEVAEGEQLLTPTALATKPAQNTRPRVNGRASHVAPAKASALTTSGASHHT